MSRFLNSAGTPLHVTEPHGYSGHREFRQYRASPGEAGSAGFIIVSTTSDTPRPVATSMSVTPPKHGDVVQVITSRSRMTWRAASVVDSRRRQRHAAGNVASGHLADRLRPLA